VKFFRREVECLINQIYVFIHLWCYSKLGVQNCLYFTIFAKGLFSLIKNSDRALAFVSVPARLKWREQRTKTGFIPVVSRKENGVLIPV
jgi:hypothetical protein